MTAELINEACIMTRSPYKRLFNKEILPIIRENIDRGEVIFREEHIKSVLKANTINSAASLYVRLTKLVPPDMGVSLRTHIDGGKVFLFYKRR